MRKFSGHQPTGEWVKVTHRKNTKPKTTHSFFVSGLPDGCSRDELKSIFQEFGKISDIYVARKKNASGKNFAFVKFADVSDLFSLDRKIRRVPIRDTFLICNLSKYDKDHKPIIPPISINNQIHHRINPLIGYTPPRTSKTFAEILTGSVSRLPTTIISSKPTVHNITLPNQIPNPNPISTACLVGRTTSIEFLCSIRSILKANGIDCTVKYAGGFHVFLDFYSNNIAVDFLNNNKVWKQWFTWLRFGAIGEANYERLVWIKVLGLPHCFWNSENFNAIAKVIGDVAAPLSFEGMYDDFSFKTIGVLTKFRRFISDEVIITIDDLTFTVGLIESKEEWFPFEDTDNSKHSTSDEDEDQDEEKWRSLEKVDDEDLNVDDLDLDLEDGEIPPDDNIDIQLPANSDDRIDSGDSEMVLETDPASTPPMIGATVDALEEEPIPSISESSVFPQVNNGKNINFGKGTFNSSFAFGAFNSCPNGLSASRMVRPKNKNNFVNFPQMDLSGLGALNNGPISINSGHSTHNKSRGPSPPDGPDLMDSTSLHLINQLARIHLI